MDILFVTSELAPFSKVGGLADVAGALPKALKGLGHKVTVLSPLYKGIDPVQRSFARRLSRPEVVLGGEKVTCEVYDGRTPGGVDLIFIGNNELFGQLDSPYASEPNDKAEARRFALLCHAAVHIAHERGFEAIHAHDWPSALALPIAARAEGMEKVARVLTIHNVAHQGIFDANMLEHLGVARELFTDGTLEMHGKINLLKAGIVSAHQVTTVSPTYGREIVEGAEGRGLEGVLRARGRAFSGILNGIDASVWNPATDSNIASRFDPMDLRGKARSKAALQDALGMPVRDDVPLLGSVGRLAPQKGYDLLVEAALRILRNDVQLAILGQGDAELVAALEDLAKRFPDRLQVRATHDEVLAHQIIAGADLFVMPSRFEPCGLTQMYAHRYGTLPIVRRTGGLVDTVIDCDAQLRSGTGFVFEEQSAEALTGAVQRGVAAFHTAGFGALQQRVMRVDHSWERSARLYERVYKDALAEKPAAA